MRSAVTARLLIISLLTTLLSTASFAFEEGALVVWINNDKAHDGLREVAKRFTADTGMSVIVKTQDDWEGSEDPASRYSKVAATVEGPDIVFWAHDRFGNWINDGLLSPVQPATELVDQIHDFAWNAVTVGDEIYGYPIAMEAISLIYNKDLVPTPPTTWNEVIALDKRLRKQDKRAIHWMTENTYFTWPLLTSAGGYSFKKVDGAYQLNDVGVDNNGAAKGVQMLNRMYREGVLQAEDVGNWGGMMDGFKAGTTAMMINGPWTWNEIKDAGINFGLAKFPKVDNESGVGRPFVGYLAAAVNSYSPNEAMVKKFLEEYVVVYDGVKTMNDDRPLGAAANKQLMAELESDLHIAHTFQMAATGETMPDIPEMKRFWSSMQTNLQPMIAGEQPVESTLERIAEKLRNLDKMKMWSRKHYLTSASASQ